MIRRGMRQVTIDVTQKLQSTKIHSMSRLGREIYRHSNEREEKFVSHPIQSIGIFLHSWPRYTTVHYHGLMDGIITSENSPRYYQHVSKTMRLKPSQLDEFYRFFRIGGMGKMQSSGEVEWLLTISAHCSGGDGAHNIGQGATSVSSLDPQNNVVLRIIDWVENGKGPETLTGTRFVNVSFRSIVTWYCIN